MHERRKNNRYRVKEGLLAVVGQHTNPNGQIIGQIMDIGNGGLALLCRRRELHIGKEATLTMMYDNGKRARNFPYRFDIMPISMLTAPPARAGGKDAPKFCCNVRFRELTYYQKNWIRQIIEDYTEATEENVLLTPSCRPEDMSDSTGTELRIDHLPFAGG